MITAVDTNVLLDVLAPDPHFGPRLADALREAIRDGSLIACEVVWAEVLIGGHAEARADRLLTRDRGFYRTDFAGLTLMDPASR